MSRKPLTPPASPPKDGALRFAGWLARLLDDAYVDPILGFVLPGVGDVLAGAMGLSLVAIACKKRLPPVVVARMLLNLALDAGLGAIPIVGDVFDLYFRANTRNLRLLEARAATGRSSVADICILALAAVVFCAAMALPVVLTVWLVRAFWQPGAASPG